MAGLSTGYVADDDIIASSVLNDVNSVKSARARPWLPSATGWIPSIDDDVLPWLTVAFTKAFDVRAVVTQGCSNEDFWVKSFSVKYSHGPDDDLEAFMDEMLGQIKVNHIWKSNMRANNQRIININTHSCPCFVFVKCRYSTQTKTATD